MLHNCFCLLCSKHLTTMARAVLQTAAMPAKGTLVCSELCRVAVACPGSPAGKRRRDLCKGLQAARPLEEGVVLKCTSPFALSCDLPLDAATHWLSLLSDSTQAWQRTVLNGQACQRNALVESQASSNLATGTLSTRLKQAQQSNAVKDSADMLLVCIGRRGLSWRPHSQGLPQGLS